MNRVSKKPILAVDIDGVINDFHTPFIEYSNKRLGTDYKYNDFDSHNLHDVFNISKDKFIEILSDYEKTYSCDDHILINGVVESLTELKNHYMIIAITGRLPRLKDVTIKFIERHVPFIKVHFALGRNNVVLSKDREVYKPQLAEQLGALYLIDDNEHEFIHWDSEKVKPICFAQPWNAVLEKTHPDIPRMQWKGIKKYLMDDVSKTVAN